MSGSEAAGLAHPVNQPVSAPVLLPGEAMDTLIGSIARLAPARPVIIGGLAVMSRVGGEHRPTLDIDSAFNNETDTPTRPRSSSPAGSQPRATPSSGSGSTRPSST